MTEVQICNMALGRIKAQPIADLITDTTKSASTCRIFYEPLRDALLQEHPWAFAVARQPLAEVTVDNYSQYSYIYQLPVSPKCLAVLQVMTAAYNESAFPFELEGDYIYSSEPSAVLKYIGQVTDPTYMDALFIDALAWRLASEMVGPLTGDPSAEPWAKYERIITKAWGADEQGKTERAVPSSRWTDERFGVEV